VTETTLFATLPMIFNILFQTFVWGPLSDRYQKRKTLIILGELFASVSTFFVWFFHTLPSNLHTAGFVIIVGLTFVEIFWSMSNVGWTAIISDFYTDRERSNIQGKLRSIGAIGNFIGIWLGGIAYDGLSRFYDGWGFSNGLLFFIASGVMVISTIPMFFVPEGGISLSKKTNNKKHIKSYQKERTYFSHAFGVFIIAMVLINFGRNSVAMIRAQYLTCNGGFNVTSRSLSYIANMSPVAIFLTGLFIGKVSKFLKDEILLITGALLSIFYLSGYTTATSLITIYISTFLQGASEVIIFASSYSYASRLIPPEHRAKQFAIFNATFFLSWGVAGTLVAGPIADLLIKTGKSQVFSYRMSFLAAAILVLSGIFILIRAYRKAKKT